MPLLAVSIDFPIVAVAPVSDHRNSRETGLFPVAVGLRWRHHAASLSAVAAASCGWKSFQSTRRTTVALP
ncbi:hypothetical protein AGR3A_Cc120053 [Agrobacterium tomkonis CFBP 6623]|uniref:Uncharacterized protein n=1 Tax=Agrobacterium tomkonis CFBP 6623 TaxID=1183432 RepID=A0A1S7NMR9_9HYPH|nr:hypothetical protein AGR3A_Cc120053 [Agrobacterium tomkonis CFBP 6623]